MSLESAVGQVVASLALFLADRKQETSIRALASAPDSAGGKRVLSLSCGFMDYLSPPTTTQRKRSWYSQDTESTPLQPTKRSCHASLEFAESSPGDSPWLPTNLQVCDESSNSTNLSFCAPFDLDLPDAYSSEVDSPDVHSAVSGEDMCESSANPSEMQDVDLEEADILYGVICDIKVEPRWVPLDHFMDFVEIPDEGQSFLTLNFSFREDHCIVQTEQGEDVAMLNQKSFDALHDLPASVHMDGLVNKAEWTGCLGAVEKGTKVVRMSIDANIFGPRTEADTVARCLSKSGLYLQHPYFNTSQMLYENPQYFDLSHAVFEVSAPPDLSDFQDMEGSEREVVQESNLSLDYDTIMDEVPQHEYLTEAPTDSDDRILSPLLSHQKTAVDFIRRRETGDIPLEESLWEQLGPNAACYKHRITGFNSETAQDALGGILADEMGLGKSLTLLAQIVASLPCANAFAGPRTMSFPPNGEGIISAKSSLIVVPSALLLDGWAEEIKRHIRPGSLSYYRYHGQNRLISRTELAEHDIVLTTYGTVAADLRRRRGMLEHINWYRLVLDEAHVIRNWSTKQFTAVSRIPAHIRWCLSGTPIQNSLDDLGALVKFLQVPILKEGNNFSAHITRKTRLSSSASTSDFENLRCLLGSICLHRNKGVLPMYQSEEHNHTIEFTPRERSQYTRLQERCKRAIDQAVSGHKTKEAHQSVLELLLRLRLFCNNGDVGATGVSSGTTQEMLSYMQQSGEAICGYCSCEVVSLEECDDPTSAICTSCPALVCGECKPRWQMDLQEKGPGCPLCGKEHEHEERLFETMNATASEAATHESAYPTKLKKLLEDIKNHQEDGKSVVFSFWKKTLDIVCALFRANGIAFYRIDGSLPFASRKSVLLNFQKSTETKVLLMTLGTGAVGLNGLSVASRLHILEPQWNPSVESQAIGRVLRLGQENPVTIIRYIVSKTVEQNVQTRQHRKVVLSRGGFKDGGKQKALLQTYSAIIS